MCRVGDGDVLMLWCDDVTVWCDDVTVWCDDVTVWCDDVTVLMNCQGVGLMDVFEDILGTYLRTY